MNGLFLTVALAQAGGLDAVLRKLGEDARSRETAAPCVYRELTTVDELGDDGAVKGSEVRRYEVEVSGAEVTRRDRLEVTKLGEPLADLLVEQKQAKRAKLARSPLHPESQAEYRFSFKDGQTLSFEPLRPDPRRVVGEAQLDEKGRLVELKVRPSKVPLLLESFSMRFGFADTACGRQAVEVDLDGKGVAVLVETRFRSRTRLEGHRPLAAAKK